MLFDPKWEVAAKPDIYALPTLIAWLEKQPADRAYDFFNCGGECLISQYMTAHGVESMVWDSKRCSSVYSAFCDDTGFDDFAVAHPRTLAAPWSVLASGSDQQSAGVRHGF